MMAKDLWDEIGKGTRLELPDDAPGEWLVTDIEDLPDGGKRVTFVRFDPA